MTVAGIMETRVVTIRVGDRVGAARDRMRRHRVRHLPVVDYRGRLVGVVKEKDIRTVDGEMGGFDYVSIARVMKRHPVTVSPTTRIQHAAQLLRSRSLGCLPVVMNGQLVGIVTGSDLLGEVPAVRGEDGPRRRPEWRQP